MAEESNSRSMNVIHVEGYSVFSSFIGTSVLDQSSRKFVRSFRRAVELAGQRIIKSSKICTMKEVPNLVLAIYLRPEEKRSNMAHEDVAPITREVS